MASGLDLRQLCILAGKTVWWLSVDALVLNDDGNVLTAISAATLAALRDTRVPKVGLGSWREGAGWRGEGGEGRGGGRGGGKESNGGGHS